MGWKGYVMSQFQAKDDRGFWVRWWLPGGVVGMVLPGISLAYGLTLIVLVRVA